MNGLRCYDEDGNITLDLTDRVTRVIHSQIVDANTSGTINVIDDINSSIMGFCYGLDIGCIPHRLVGYTLYGIDNGDGTQTQEWEYEFKGFESFPSSRSLIIFIGY